MPDDQSDHPVTVYWRPGCGFCASLLRGLDKSGLRYERADIWEDEEAAAYVRSVARGNETVPTVRIGDTALVNPSTQQVLATVAAEVPDHLPDGYVPPEPGRVGRMINKMLGD